MRDDQSLLLTVSGIRVSSGELNPIVNKNGSATRRAQPS